MFHYLRKRFLMRSNEWKFYKKLDSAVGLTYKVLPQVHLDELVTTYKNKKYRKFSFRHINQKSVDFVICDKTTLIPKVAIELDGKSHLKEDVKIRDQEVERILEEIRLPLLRFDNNNTFTTEEIRHKIRSSIES